VVELKHERAVSGRFHEVYLAQIFRVLENIQSNKVVAVAHSGAGSLLTSICPKKFHACVFLDSIFGLAPASRFDLFNNPTALASWRQSAEENGGFLTPEFLEPLSKQIEDSVLRQRFVSTLIEVPIEVYEERISPHCDWNSVANGLYVRWTESYHADASRAKESGIEVLLQPGTHFEMLNSPALVAGVLTKFVGSIG